MIKYYCDMCKKEMRKDEHYTYILPQQIPYGIVSGWSWEEPIYTYEQLEDRKTEVCNVCRRKIAQALKELTRENKNGNK